MKSIHPSYLLFFLFALGSIISCENKDSSPQQTSKYLFHPQKKEMDLKGSVIRVDGGIMVLVQNGPLYTVPVILLPANDSAKAILNDSYDRRLDNSYQLSQKPWVKVAGNFIREDSLSPIFKFSWIELLDHTSELKEIQEMEE